MLWLMYPIIMKWGHASLILHTKSSNWQANSSSSIRSHSLHMSCRLLPYNGGGRQSSASAGCNASGRQARELSPQHQRWQSHFEACRLWPEFLLQARPKVQPYCWLSLLCCSRGEIIKNPLSWEGSTPTHYTKMNSGVLIWHFTSLTFAMSHVCIEGSRYREWPTMSDKRDMLFLSRRLLSGVEEELWARSRHVEPGGHPVYLAEWPPSLLGRHWRRYIQNGAQGQANIISISHYEGKSLYECQILKQTHGS